MMNYKRWMMELYHLDALKVFRRLLFTICVVCVVRDVQ